MSACLGALWFRSGLEMCAGVPSAWGRGDVLQCSEGVNGLPPGGCLEVVDDAFDPFPVKWPHPLDGLPARVN
ncbi:hypothetical protein TSOC_012613 [Tetrabaena socialis]|uniref:Secreted protein n=1 Tax=Tetrabaena socialis TaxID=47790 RepID=A0A2J7ZMK3_9CHLO|nr:hypothetical protein TSOC_012613 [Tetrabaena socialis]|eukprot:PNH01491.1 hypothetical protein TSOC_012613 [Tetrabaena socialis]